MGRLELGAQADLAIIDPEVLRQWDDVSTRQLVYRDLFEHQQMVSRSDGVVTHTFINGEAVWRDGDFTDVLGSRPLGRALRAA